VSGTHVEEGFGIDGDYEVELFDTSDKGVITFYDLPCFCC